MKKNVIVMILSLVSVSLLNVRQGFTQDETSDFRFSVKANPLAALGGPFYVVGFVPVTGEYKVVLETRTLNKQSFQLGLSYLGPSLIINLEQISDSIASISVDGLRIQGMYKFFLTSTDRNLEGFYVAPHFSYAGAKIVDKDSPDDFLQASKININAVLGYQIITSGGFALDIYTGLGYRSVTWKYNTTNSAFSDLTDKSGANVTLGLSFGYAF